MRARGQALRVLWPPDELRVAPRLGGVVLGQARPRLAQAQAQELSVGLSAQACLRADSSRAEFGLAGWQVQAAQFA